MLPIDHRLRRSADFKHVVRRGRRVTSPSLVVHVLPAPGEPAHIGFVVSKAVGKAHIRNLVKRRLRHASREQLAALDGLHVVMRAKPGAAGADWTQLLAEVRQCCERVVATR